MNNNGEYNLDHFVDRLREGDLAPEEIAEFEGLLLGDKELRRRYRARMRMEAHLLAKFQSAQPGILPPLMTSVIPRRRSQWWPLAAGAGIAALIALVFLSFPRKTGPTSPPTVARILSVDGAAWASTQATSVGSELSPGELHLVSGLATIRFLSGAMVSLEAPVRLVVIDPMRCRIIEGTAVIEAPDSAKGFVVEAPGGYAVDHGTRFAVSVNEDGKSADFGVLVGKISVHHGLSKQTTTLDKGQAAHLSAEGIEAGLRPFPGSSSPVPDPNIQRLRTNGHETSIIRTNQRGEFLSPDLLMVKKDLPFSNEDKLPEDELPKDRRAFIGFDLDGIEPDGIDVALLRLNLVPSGLGYASCLPEVSTFEVYGIRDDRVLESWATEGMKWEEAPGSEGQVTDIDTSEVRLLGTLEIPRARMDGPVVFESGELTKFVREDANGHVGFMLSMRTLPSKDWSLVHAFAASTHPSAAGPVLELKLEHPDG